jgi:hypothetical protein
MATDQREQRERGGHPTNESGSHRKNNKRKQQDYAAANAAAFLFPAAIAAFIKGVELPNP